MGRLVKCELYKILHKKNIYIISFVTFFFFVLGLFWYRGISSSELISVEFNKSVIFIVIVIIITSCVIVSDEYNGTIKQLLVKPYKRYEILLSKLITCIIIFLFFLLFYLFLCIVFYGINGDFKSYFDIININDKSLCVLEYVLLSIIGSLPEYFIILSLCFLCSVLFTSSSSLVIGFFYYFFSFILNDLIIKNNIKWLYYFPTMCSNLNEYIYGSFKSCNIGVCIMIDVVLIVLFIFLSFVIFCNKDVKNQ